MVHEPFVSYAQNGEDVVLARALAPDDQPGFWIDVGAGDPVADSVTHAFSRRGWTGINIEPSTDQYELLVEQRPHDVQLRCAVGRRAGFAKLYPGPAGHSGLSTLVPAIAERHYLRELDVPEPVEVEVRTLAEIVDQYAPTVVDFLKVDVEGFEHDVLAGANWACFRPRVVVVEATEPNTRVLAQGKWEHILVDHGYRFVMFDGLNRFYAADGEDELAASLAAPANVLDDFVRHQDVLDLERAQERALSLETTLAAERLDVGEALTGLRLELAESQGQVLRLEAEAADARARYASELHDLARRCRATSDRAEHADELVANLRDDLTAAQVRAALAMGAASRLSAYVDAVEATHIFRSTRRLREVYSRARRQAGLDR